jgi:hypothetical protein
MLNLCAEIISYRRDSNANNKVRAEAKLFVHIVKNVLNLKGRVVE